MIISWLISPLGERCVSAAGGMQSADRSRLLPSVRLATTWMNEEWYNDQVRSLIDRDWVGFTLLYNSCFC